LARSADHFSGDTEIARWSALRANQDLGVRAEVEAGEVEEGQQVAVPDVEEEVAGALVVAVLDDLGQREFQDALVKADRPLHVGAEQRGVVDAAGAAGRAAVRDVDGVQPGAFGFDGGEIHAPERNAGASLARRATTRSALWKQAEYPAANSRRGLRAVKNLVGPKTDFTDSD